MGFRKHIAPLLPAVLVLGLAACGSSDQPTTTVKPPPLSASTANRLGELSDRVASYLDDGLTCDAAHAADELQATVEEADLSATLRPGVEEVATRLVNEVNCPPPPPKPEKEKKKKKGEDHQDQNRDEEKGNENKPPGHGGIAPGQAKLRGE